MGIAVEPPSALLVVDRCSQGDDMVVDVELIIRRVLNNISWKGIGAVGKSMVCLVQGLM